MMIIRDCQLAQEIISSRIHCPRYSQQAPVTLVGTYFVISGSVSFEHGSVHIMKGAKLDLFQPVCISAPNIFIAVPADGLAPYGARPSAGSVMRIWAPKNHVCVVFSHVSVATEVTQRGFYDQMTSFKCPTRSGEVSRHFQYAVLYPCDSPNRNRVLAIPTSQQWLI